MKLTVIQKILKESEAYRSLEQIESVLQSGGGLGGFPVQPLFVLIRQLDAGKVAQVLTQLSRKQRQAFLDLDLWSKDNLDVEAFEFWIKAYSQVEDEKVLHEFIESSEFELYLKGRLNIWTFDVEDPLYPDHDNYFLTEDNLLLFEFHDEFESIQEVRHLIKELYSKYGVEKAYARLFKLTTDSFSSMQEQEYQAKKYRLAQLGIVDYFDSLEFETVYPNQDFLDAQIRKKKRKTPRLDSLSRQQALHSSYLMAFRSDEELFSSELLKVESQERLDYLRFNFLRLVNGAVTFHEALRDGRVAMARIGNMSKASIELGFDYLNLKREVGDLEIKEEQSLFDFFDFVDLYRYGKSLFSFGQKEISDALKKTVFDSDDKTPFLGKFLSELIDFSFDSPVKVCEASQEGRANIINSIKRYNEWRSQVKTLCHISPFAQKFYEVYEQMLESGGIQDRYYINYNVAEIDLEAVLISSFANFILGHYKDANSHKMGLTLSDFREFVKIFFTPSGELIKDDKNMRGLRDFFKNYGLDSIYRIEEYFLSVLCAHLEGYDFLELKENDYKHIGGPIILDPGQ